MKDEQQAEQTLRYWEWLKEQRCNLVYFPEVKEWAVWEPPAVGRKTYARCSSPEEAVQAAMDGQLT